MIFDDDCDKSDLHIANLTPASPLVLAAPVRRCQHSMQRGKPSLPRWVMIGGFTNCPHAVLSKQHRVYLCNNTVAIRRHSRIWLRDLSVEAFKMELIKNASLKWSG